MRVPGKKDGLIRRAIAAVLIASLLLMVGLFCGGCGLFGGDEPEKKPKAATKKTAGKKQTAEAAASKAEEGKEEVTLEALDAKRRAKQMAYSFSSSGKADPFQPIASLLPTLMGETPEVVEAEGEEEERVQLVETPLQKIAIEDLKLKAVVSDIPVPKAILEDNTGTGFIVEIGTPVGPQKNKGKVTNIYPDSIDIMQVRVIKGKQITEIKNKTLREEGETQ